ncbi:type II and III secretion system protein family protein [Vibrio renipiscarius]|uniref:General secretion pathway protein GspD n=1 Tax=Vibrio renipiscarius TaxID=1461322 RepID=A0A0C2JM53_9VIBR|nr:type II and III secretion system protein family protein [Vibrio renipiscarius]KII76015.1 general secretion pathway protein GspD [Vibrio renipiscarius]KII79119.1 general secretion pathway protein GspD [Vibrio renipiscarius]
MQRVFSNPFLLILGLFTSSLFAVSVSANNALYLMEGEAKPVITAQDIDTVFVANPEIADYQVIDRKKIVVFGKKMGTTSLMVFDENAQTLVNRKLVINQSFDEIIQQVRLHFPRSQVTVSNIGNQVVLTGTVATAVEKDGINDLVGELLSKNVEKTTHTWTKDEGEDEIIDFMTKRKYAGIVNQIEVATTKQVNVKLSIAEVSQNFMENFGVQYGSAGQTAGVFVNPILDFSANDLLATISAVGDDSVGQILAEPNLSVISGESASFLVGGEIPVVTVVDGGTNVEFKEFGIRLDMVAKVLRDDKIKLSLQPEVSSLDTQYANELFSLPALKTRRAKTTIELGNGQSFVLAGLLSSEDVELLRKVPYIGDIPILGALFRHTETSRNKTELVIVATVNLVKPVEATQVQLPSMLRTSNLSRFFGLSDVYTPVIEQRAQDILTTGGFKK